MRIVTLLVLASLAVPTAAHAGDSTRGDQIQRKTPQLSPCASRDREPQRPLRERLARTECKVSTPVPPVVDPTPIFLP